ncbi:MAG: hypothetical protein H6584_04805 [Flavobacteriales bacterium]|nr:hypothetical protein [Flavobacteriales bacterium]
MSKLNIPVKPKDWCLTYEDLKQEAKSGKRKTIRRYEIEWANEYEKSLIPKGYRYPHIDDVYVFNQELTLFFSSQWSGPWGSGDYYTFQKGMKCQITYGDNIIRPERFYLRPFNYEEILDDYRRKYDPFRPYRCTNISFNIYKEEFDKYFELYNSDSH